MDFAVTLSLLDRTPEQLATLAAIVQRHNLELDVDDHRLASLKSLQGLAEPEPNHKGQAGPGRFPLPEARLSSYSCDAAGIAPDA